MRKKILLCISNDLGLKILKILKKKYYVKVYSTKKINEKHKYIEDKEKFLFHLKNESKFDWIICVYWPFIIDKKLFFKFKDSINFHPSYLPYCKGWYPNVIAKVFGFKYGVTLHRITKHVDGGPIWCQKRIGINLLDDSKKIYNTAQKEIMKIFKKNYQKIINNEIKPFKQNKVKNFFSKKLTNSLNKINLEKKMKVKDLINLSFSRQFGNNTYMWFKYKNENYSFSIKVKKLN